MEEAVKGNLISIPQVIIRTAPEKIVDSNLPFEISSATMKELIRHKFPEGKLSAKEINRREEVQQKRKRKQNESEPEIILKEIPKPEIIKYFIKFIRSGPKLKVVDGKMVVDTSAVPTQEEVIDEDLNVIDEDASSRYVTSASFRNKHKLVAPKWTPQMSERFYDVILT